jgi:hypothetical protein
MNLQMTEMDGTTCRSAGVRRRRGHVVEMGVTIEACDRTKRSRASYQQCGERGIDHSEDRAVPTKDGCVDRGHASATATDGCVGDAHQPELQKNAQREVRAMGLSLLAQDEPASDERVQGGAVPRCVAVHPPLRGKLARLRWPLLRRAPNGHQFPEPLWRLPVRHEGHCGSLDAAGTDVGGCSCIPIGAGILPVARNSPHMRASLGRSW